MTQFTPCEIQNDYIQEFCQLTVILCDFVGRIIGFPPVTAPLWKFVVIQMWRDGHRQGSSNLENNANTAIFFQ